MLKTTGNIAEMTSDFFDNCMMNQIFTSLYVGIFILWWSQNPSETLLNP